MDELSLETTGGTDLSISPDEVSDLQTTADDDPRLQRHNRQSSGLRPHHCPTCSNSDNSRQLLDKKQLLHDVQALKIELSQKSLMIDNMKSQYIQKVEELEERLGDERHQNQILKTRLEAQLSIDQDDSRRQQDQIRREFDAIRQRQQQLEMTNERLVANAVCVRRNLKDFELTDSQHAQLKTQNEDDMALRDFVALKLYEKERPWRIENESLRSRSKHLQEEVNKLRTALEKCTDELEEEKKARLQLDTKHQRLMLAYADVKTQVQSGDFKIENYDKVKRERDEFETELNDLRKRITILDASHQMVSKERDEQSIELASTKQAVALLKQDKDFFSKQVSELHNKLLYADEKLVQLNEQTERAKQSREELYDKYVVSRDQYKSEYDEKLRMELEQIRFRTETEIDRLKTSTREMYERENRSLREARDNAISEKDRAVTVEKETNTKYEQLLQDYRQQQMTNDARILEMNNEVKMKSFEAERTQLVYSETTRVLKDVQIENEKLQKKLEVLTKQYYSLQTSMEKQVTQLESTVNDKTTKLETYERLEQELDEVVMQAADIENEDEAERVMFSYGYGANVPTNAKRRLKQSVHLARRVLQLERANTSMRSELDRNKDTIIQMAAEVKSANQLLDDSQQPSTYLVDSIRKRDLEIGKLKKTLAVMQEDLRRSEAERGELVKTRTKMSLDLERLLNHKEEMEVMKRVVISLRHPEYKYDKPTKASELRSTRKVVSRVRKSPGRPKSPSYPYEPPEKDENVHQPTPTAFTVNAQRKTKPEQRQYASIRQVASS